VIVKLHRKIKGRQKMAGIAKWDELEEVRDLGGVLKIFTKALGTEKMDVVVGKFEPGEGLPAHYHKEPTEEVYFVYEGDITVYVGDKEIPASKGTALLAPPGVVHRLSNTGNKTAWIVFVHAPTVPGEDHLVLV
jgi:mannose-6-phosphate isomerase-like protein (cupin superfamily)